LWTIEPDDEVHLVISASSFCQQMVRSIAGLCVDVGLGSTPVDDVPAILAARDRTAVPRVAPPQGLFLLRVDYPAEGQGAMTSTVVDAERPNTSGS
jgi:tRNA pseudouridine38-40 synthase